MNIDPDFAFSPDAPAADQLAALIAVTAHDRRRWRRWRLFELVCAVCGETILEVMATQPHVILPRGSPRKIVYGRPLPLDGDGEEPIVSICRCRSPVVTRGQIRGWMSQDAKYSLPADQGSSARTHDTTKTAELIARFTAQGHNTQTTPGDQPLH
jgi:hypothetical protein